MLKVVNCRKYSKHDDENQYISCYFPRELPVGARQWKFGYGIPFGVALLNLTVGGDGKSPIQLADLALDPMRPRTR